MFSAQEKVYEELVGSEVDGLRATSFLRRDSSMELGAYKCELTTSFSDKQAYRT